MHQYVAKSCLCGLLGRGCGVCSAPRVFDPRTADAGWPELGFAGLQMGGLLELLLYHCILIVHRLHCIKA
jgi:hypothetical protein